MAPNSNNPEQDDRTHEFLLLMGRCERRLHSFILALVPNWADCEEILQETRIKLWEQFDNYDPEQNFSAWARKIAYYNILSFRKKSMRSSARMSNEFVELLSEQADKHFNEPDSRQLGLQHCLQQLSQNHRELLWRCYSDKNSVKGVAQLLGRSVRGTQQTVARIRMVLQQCIEKWIRREEQE